MSVKALLPYVGEFILRAILEEKPQEILREFGKSPDSTVKVYSQVKLSFPKTDIKFDGCSRLDLGMIVDDKFIIPIEVKLGETGLGLSRIKANHAECFLSDHGNKRIAGNMFAVLDRRFNHKLRTEIGASILHGTIDDRSYPSQSQEKTYEILPQWGIIARKSVQQNWQKNNDTFTNAHFFAVEDICDKFGRGEFERLASKILESDNYYDEWLKGK